MIKEKYYCHGLLAPKTIAEARRCSLFQFGTCHYDEGECSVMIDSGANPNPPVKLKRDGSRELHSLRELSRLVQRDGSR